MLSRANKLMIIAVEEGSFWKEIPKRCKIAETSILFSLPRNFSRST